MADPMEEDIREDVVRARQFIQQRQGGVPPGMTDLQALAFSNLVDFETLSGALDYSQYRNTLNAQDDQGMTALMYAAKKHPGENGEAVRVLIEAGADKTIRNVQGETALDVFREALAQDQANLQRIREGHRREVLLPNLNEQERREAEQALAEMHAQDDAELEEGRQLVEGLLRVEDERGGRRRKTKQRKTKKRKTLRRRRRAL